MKPDSTVRACYVPPVNWTAGPARRSTPIFASLLSLALALPALGGCHGSGPKPKVAGEQQPPLKVTAVSDAEFGKSTHRLLRESTQTPERAGLLAGAVRRQLVHAQRHFEAGNSKRGTNAVVGALYLLRMGELRDGLIDGEANQPLDGAIVQFSARGDEGRVLALMELRKKLLPKGSPELAKLEKRRKGLQRWIDDTRTGGDMSRLAADRRRAVGRSLLEPSDEALQQAATAVNAWLERAIRYNLAYQQTQKLPPRAELGEAFRALDGGAATMASVFLRHGRAKEAADIIEASAARRVAPPALFARLRAVADDDDAETWRELARLYAMARAGRADDKTGLGNVDGALLNAALWGVALEAYRRDPTSLAVSHILADRLLELEMSEVAPLVLHDALGAEPSAVALSAALSTVGQSLAAEVGGSPEGARVIYQNSAAILALADKPAYRGKLRPSAATIRQTLAGIELRGGALDRARALLKEALEREPSIWGFTMLAALERQAGKNEAALGYVNRGIALPGAAAMALDTVDAKLLAFELLRDKGQKDRAGAMLADALKILLARRGKLKGAAAQVRAERQLARVLDGYGETKRAARAIARSIDIAQNNRQILGPTVLGAVSRALVQDNLQAARVALQTGIHATLSQDDLVYGALWLMLLEKKLNESPDGKVDRILQEAVNGKGWPRRLARWANGLSNDAELMRAASSQAEKVEAQFYVAMRGHVMGKASAMDELRAVSRNPMIDLMEVQIARDLLAPTFAGKLPARAQLP